MCVSRFGAEKGYGQRAFQRTAAGNDFPKNRADSLRREGPAIQAADPLKNFLLALGYVDLLTA